MPPRIFDFIPIEPVMLKITDSGPGKSPRVLKLEGKLLAAWIEELRGQFVAEDSASWPHLDLAGVSYVDRPAAAMLRQLLEEGVRLEACSQFVAELLNCRQDSKA